MNNLNNILFVINPIAGKGHTNTILHFIRREMKNHPARFTVIMEKDREIAGEKIRRECEKADLVISIGGDGSNFFVLQQVMRTSVRNMGLIPTGTGNDFISSLHEKRSFIRILREILDGKPTPVDIGKANEFYFFNIASLGFDAAVGEIYDALPRPHFGKMTYIYALLKTLKGYKSREYRIQWENNTLVYPQGFLVAVGNGKYYGGGLPIIPDAQVNDGILDIVGIHDLPNSKAAWLLPKLLSGKHIEIKEKVDTLQSRQVTVSFQGEEQLNLDGELYPVKDKVEFSILPEEIYLFNEISTDFRG